MKMCLPHWGALKTMIVDKGMGGLITVDAEAAHTQILEEIEGTASVATYDPLMAANWMLMGMAVKHGGLYLMYGKPGDGGEYCPLCEVEAAGVRFEDKAGLSVEWLEGCTDTILEYCRGQRLLPKLH